MIAAEKVGLSLNKRVNTVVFLLWFCGGPDFTLRAPTCLASDMLDSKKQIA